MIEFATVDRLVVTSIVDGTYNCVVPARRFGTVEVQRANLPRPPSLVAEHGLAFQLVSTRGDQQRQILLDFGLTGQALFNNLGLLHIDVREADALVLSQGHGDHYGGLLALASATPSWAEHRTRLYAGGEDTFCRRWTVTPDGHPTRTEQLVRSEVEAHGLRVVLAKEPMIVADHALLSGQIPRVTSYETGLPNARLEVGAPDSECGVAAHLSPSQTAARARALVPDSFLGEVAVIYVVKGRGLVVVSSCGHAGIVNTVLHARQVTGVEHVHAVIGGWHLADATDDIIACTVAAFEEFQPDYFVPMHCTGFSIMARLERSMPGRVIEPSVGTQVILSGA
jgi:7,8-dihydropterin-6-yl-methyl-4-(beta-D-ribofuranosyl)aminobenzene 5'-phosphate synthase